MQYTDNEAALIGGLISTYFFQPAVSAPLKDAYSRGCEFSDAHVPSKSADAAGAYGHQCADNSASEHLA